MGVGCGKRQPPMLKNNAPGHNALLEDACAQ
jgi:hypothetical protein